MIEKPVSRLVQELDAQSFTVLGCACHGGLGAEAMHFLRSGLSGAEGDFIVVAGDAVPLGRDPYYRTMSRFINAYAAKPVHVLKCNHDGPDFGEYFGHADRAVIAEDFLLVMLDNSERRFSDETLEFLRETMAIIDSRNVIVAFHVPPPNRISGNTMDAGEWRRFEDAIGVWRNRITLLLAGHEHCYYEDDIDGLRLVASGGSAGPGDCAERATPRGCHAVEVGMGEDGCPAVRVRMLDAGIGMAGMTGGKNMGGIAAEEREMLVHALELQCRNHVSMRLCSEESENRGDAAAAHLYRAAAESALTQARILRRVVLGGKSGLPEMNRRLEEQIAGFSGFGESGEDAGEQPGGEAFLMHTLESIDRTQANTLSLLTGIGGTGIGAGAEGYFLCSSCGMLFPGRESPNYCPACAAPYYALREVK